MGSCWQSRRMRWAVVLLPRGGEVAWGGEPKTNRRVEKLSVQLVSSLSCAVRPSALFYASVLVQLMCPSPVYRDPCAAIIFAGSCSTCHLGGRVEQISSERYQTATFAIEGRPASRQQYAALQARDNTGLEDWSLYGSSPVGSRSLVSPGCSAHGC